MSWLSRHITKVGRARHLSVEVAAPTPYIKSACGRPLGSARVLRTTDRNEVDCLVCRRVMNKGNRKAKKGTP